MLKEPRLLRVYAKRTTQPSLSSSSPPFEIQSSDASSWSKTSSTTGDRRREERDQNSDFAGRDEWRHHGRGGYRGFGGPQWRGGRGGHHHHSHRHAHEFHSQYAPASNLPQDGAAPESYAGYYHHHLHKIPKIKDLDARFVAHVTHDDGCQVPAGSSFKKVWRVRNNGAARWPEGTSLVRVDRGNELSAPDVNPLTVLPAPEEEVDVSVTLSAPRSHGQYSSYFKFLSPGGKKFGQRVRCQILSVPGERTEIWEQLEQMGFKPNENPQLVAKIIAQEQGNLNNIVRALLQPNS